MMDATRVLEHLSPWLPEPLIAEARLREIAGLASALPRWWMSGIFECRLDPRATQVDFMVSAYRRRLTGKKQEIEALPESAKPLFAEWLEERSCLASVPLVWLEYDAPKEKLPRPLMSVCLNPDHRYPEEITKQPAAQQRRIAEIGLELMTGRKPSPVLLDRIEHCAETLPTHGIEHVAPLAARGSENIRLTAYLPNSKLDGWLKTIGWPGDRRAFLLLSNLIERWPVAGVQIELGPDPTNYLGVEVAVDPDADSLSRASYLLRTLTGLGIVDPQKAAAALGWVGADVVQVPGEDWPIRLGRTLYFKLVLKEDRSPEIKAYLGFFPRHVLF